VAAEELMHEGLNTRTIPGPRGRAQRGAAQRGFTLLELMVVMAIIVILMTIATGKFEQMVVRAREATLASDLKVLRQAIQDYTRDKECGPSSLDDLVSNNYLRSVPKDPMTSQADWVTKSDDVSLSPEQSCYGISDVNSASDRLSPFTSTPYSSW
jgi:general secretion pathway protein G